MALSQQEVRLPCRRCLRRLARAKEIDKDEVLVCHKEVGRILCDYCNRLNKHCLSVCE